MQSGRPIRALQVLGAPLVLLTGGWHRLWLGDDGFINVRVAKQLIAGHGFVFNAGERVEAVTSPLWALILACVGAVGIRIEDGAMALGLVMSTAGLALSCAAAMHWMKPKAESGLVLPFGALAYAAIPAAWDYVTSGLENGLGLLWYGGSLFLTVRACETPTRRPLFASAFAVGVAPLVRPDFALLAAPLGLLLVWHSETWPQRCKVALAGLFPGLSFQIFRMGYFAALTPNTALAKEAFFPRWEQGLHYLWNAFGTYWLSVPVLCVLVGLTCACVARRSEVPAYEPIRQTRLVLVGVASAFGGLSHIVYVTRLGGDFMHARLLLPGLFALCSAAAVLPLTPPGVVTTRIARSALGIVFAWALFCAGTLRVNRHNEHAIGDERGWHARQAERPNPFRLEHYTKFFFHSISLQQRRTIESTCPPGRDALASNSTVVCQRTAYLDTSAGQLTDRKQTLPLAPAAAPRSVVAVMAARPLGIPGEVLGLRVNLADAYGLADPLAARLEFANRGRPGHEKELPSFWFAARYAADGSSKDRRVAVAKRVLACADLRELDEAIRAPLTFGRFIDNLTRAFRLQALRVPRDPAVAERNLCHGV